MSIINYRNENTVALSSITPTRMRVKKSIFEHLQTFLADQNSKNTFTSYGRNILLFYGWFKADKDIRELTEEDLDITNDEFKDYRIYLKSHPNEYSNNTINNMVAPVQSLYSYFERAQLPVRAAWVSLNPLPDDSERTGSLRLDEAKQMQKLVLNTSKGFEKSVLIELAYTTSFRKESMLELTLQQIKQNLVDPNIYNIEIFGKGNKKHLIHIEKELYEKLVEVSELPYRKRKNDGKIFGLSKTTVQTMMDYLRAEMKFPTERNIKFHSFRNVATTLGTLEEAKNHLNHSSVVVTNKSYKYDNPDFSNSLSLRVGEQIDNSIFEELTKEQLIELILSQQNGVVHKMKKEAISKVK